MRLKLATGKIIPKVKPEDIWRFTRLQKLYNTNPKGTFHLPSIITAEDLDDALNSQIFSTKTLGGLYAQEIMGGLILRLEINGKEYNSDSTIEILSEKISNVRILYEYQLIFFDFKHEEGQINDPDYRWSVCEEMKKFIRSNLECEKCPHRHSTVTFRNFINFFTFSKEMDDHTMDIIFLLSKDSLCHDTVKYLMESFLYQSAEKDFPWEMLERKGERLLKYLDENGYNFEKKWMDSQQPFNEIKSLGGLLMAERNGVNFDHKLFCIDKECCNGKCLKNFTAHPSYTCKMEVMEGEGEGEDCLLIKFHYAESRDDLLKIEGHYDLDEPILRPKYIPPILPRHLWELLKNTKFKKLQLQVVTELRKNLYLSNFFREIGKDLQLFREYANYLNNFFP
jgi:hypothetical protein